MYPEIIFSANTLFADAKIFASTHSVFESFSAVHTYRFYPEIFWFALEPSSFTGENPEMSMRIIAI